MKRLLLRGLELFFWSAAAILLGLYALVYLDRNVYQAYEDWRFDRELQHEPAPVVGFLLDSLRFGGTDAPPPSSEPAAPYQSLRPVEAVHRRVVRPGELIGRIEIPRIGVHAMIADGTTEKVLRRAVGHIEGTPLPGESGNAGLAGHRDTLFRALRRIRRNDLIVVTTLGGTYRYQVESVRVVEPEDVAVLNATAHPTLTLVTCYPFDYIGSAPHRFIVRAREIGVHRRGAEVAENTAN